MDPTRRSDQETPERWEKALKRATAEGVIVRQLRNGEWIATGSDGETAYTDSATTCDRHAGEAGDPSCKIRASLWQRLGLLAPVPDPTPIRSNCHDCLGSGYVRIYRSGKLDDWIPAPAMHVSGLLSPPSPEGARMDTHVAMGATFYVEGGSVGWVEAEMTIAQDGSLTVTTKRKVKGLEIVELPRRIDSARELIEALTG